MLDPMHDDCIKLYTKKNLEIVKKDFKVYCYARIYVLCKSENSSDQVESKNSTNQVESENEKTQKKKKQNIQTKPPQPFFKIDRLPKKQFASNKYAAKKSEAK